MPIQYFKVGFILTDEDYENLPEILSNAADTTPCADYFESASVHILAIPYPSESYDTKIYISNRVQKGCNISWYRLWKTTFRSEYEEKIINLNHIYMFVLKDVEPMFPLVYL